MFSFVRRSCASAASAALPHSAALSAPANRFIPVGNYSYTVSSCKRQFSTKQKPLFSKILIANRGEIACRIIRSCNKLGIKSVAVYSTADANAMHVKMADEAYCIGPPQTNSSYLNIPNIIEAVKKSGAQAVHPGYGFLSENRHFQGALQDIGVKFIGPGQHAITVMSNKISSKTAAQKAGVSVIPGYLGSVANDEELLKICNEIGYPVMIKAAHGGGGKGMRIAWNDDDARSGFRLSKAEAITSFGNDTMFVEKYIEQPRHIEIQLLADSHGNAVFLNERECTVQRRNQKVIEEAPSIFLDEKTRNAMGEQAVALAKAVGYESAGTCEFLVDKYKKFYYLELNTRLQVEHPVTELITGVDIVEQMIRVAAGESLPFTQKQIPIKGWAFESRVYAEDPLRGFLPSIGKLQKYQEPAGPNIRVDTGIREGSEISIYYDPMIAKVITFAPTRDEALSHMRTALDETVVRGVTHNINFLRSLCDHPRFISGDMTTAFIPEEYPDGYKGKQLTAQEQSALLACAASVYARIIATQTSVNGEGKTQSFNAQQFQLNKLKDIVITLGNEKYSISVQSVCEQADRTAQLTLTITHGSTSSTVNITSSYQYGDVVIRTHVNGTPYTFQIGSFSEGTSTASLIYCGTTFPLSVRSRREEDLNKYMPVIESRDTSKLVVSPMPGAVFSVRVKVGDVVAPGEEVAVVEAMKMQNALRAVNGGTVKAVKVKPGQTVSADEVLIEFQ